MILRELVTRLGFKLDETNLKKFEKSIDGAKSKLGELSKSMNTAKLAFVAITAGVTGLSLLAASTAKTAKNIDNLASKLNISTDDLQSLELVAQSAGLGVNELSKSFEVFNNKLGTVGTSSKQATKDLLKLGVSTVDQNGNLKSSFTLYEETAKKISAIKDPIKQAALSQRLLGTSNKDVAKIFDTTSESFQKQREEITKLGYVIDGEGIQASKDFIKTWNTLKIVIDGVKKELSVKFMPVFSRAINRFKDWYVINRKVVSQGITTFINILSKAFEALVRIIDLILTPFKFLINLMGGLDNTLNVLSYTLAILAIPRVLAFASAMRVLSVALLTNPVTLVVAAVVALSAAIALLIDDIMHWLDGNESLIGDLLGDWVDFKDAFVNIIDNIVNYFKNSFTSLAEWFSTLFDGMFKAADSNLKNIKTRGGVTVTQELLDKPLNDPENVLRKIQLVDESNLNDEKRILRKIELVDESNLNDSPVANKLQPIVSPASSLGGIVPNSFNSSSNNVNQYITENVTVNVPAGTSADQSKAISDQVTNIFQEQFNYNMLRGLDSLSNR